MSDQIEDEVLEEIYKITGLRHPHLHQRLYHDLCVTGDDAGELLDNLHYRFGTRYDGFDFHKYFSDEPDLLMSLIEKWFPSVISERPLTIKHLVDVVRAGKWFDPPD